MILAPRPGDYGVVGLRGFADDGIRLVTRSWATHAFIVDNDGFVIEAEPGGVRRAPLSEYDDCRIAFNTSEPTTTTQRTGVLAFARSRLGVPYNWDADVVDGLAHLGLRWRMLGRFAAGRRAVMCSQLVAEAGAAAGLPGWRCGKPDAAAVVPADLAARIDAGRWT